MWFWFAATIHNVECSGKDYVFEEHAIGNTPNSFRLFMFGMFKSGSTSASLMDNVECVADASITCGGEEADPSSSSSADVVVASSRCLNILIADKVVFVVTAMSAIAIHVWLLMQKYTVRAHDFQKTDQLFNFGEKGGAEFKSADLKLPFTPSKYAALSKKQQSQKDAERKSSK